MLASSPRWPLPALLHYFSMDRTFQTPEQTGCFGMSARTTGTWASTDILLLPRCHRPTSRLAETNGSNNLRRRSEDVNTLGSVANLVPPIRPTTTITSSDHRRGPGLCDAASLSVATNASSRRPLDPTTILTAVCSLRASVTRCSMSTAILAHGVSIAAHERVDFAPDSSCIAGCGRGRNIGRRR